MNCGSIWNWHGITGKSNCQRFKADIAFCFLASILFLVSALLVSVSWYDVVNQRGRLIMIQGPVRHAPPPYHGYRWYSTSPPLVSLFSRLNGIRSVHRGAANTTRCDTSSVAIPLLSQYEALDNLQVCAIHLMHLEQECMVFFGSDPR